MMINMPGGLLCILMLGIGGSIWIIWKVPKSQNKRQRWAGILLIGFVIFFLVWLSFPLLNMLVPSLLVKSVHIDVNEIPVYPNAQKVAQEGPIETDYEGEKSIWKFSTTDTPDEVWRFYKNELEQRWGFYENESNAAEKLLLLDSCPFYYLEMSNKPKEDGSYEFTVSFSKELCR